MRDHAGAEVSGAELYLRYERPVLIRLGNLKQPIRISLQNIIMIITPLCVAGHFIVHEKRVTATQAVPAIITSSFFENCHK